MKKSLLALAALAVLIPAHHAQAIDKVYSPTVTKGELELEYNGNIKLDGNGDKNNIQEHETEVEYGLTDRVMLEASGQYAKEPYDNLRGTGFGLGGRYQFFEQGQYWLDAGALFSYSHSTLDATPDTIEAKLLLEKQTGLFLHRANVGIEQDVGRYAQGGPDRVLGWNSRYLLNSYVQPGFEIQSDFGKASDHPHWADQEHYIGPALYGSITPNLKYEAAYYLGLTEASSTHAARVLLEYEMYF